LFVKENVTVLLTFLYSHVCVSKSQQISDYKLLFDASSNLSRIYSGDSNRLCNSPSKKANSYKLLVANFHCFFPKINWVLENLNKPLVFYYTVCIIDSVLILVKKMLDFLDNFSPFWCEKYLLRLHGQKQKWAQAWN